MQTHDIQLFIKAAKKKKKIFITLWENSWWAFNVGFLSLTKIIIIIKSLKDLVCLCSLVFASMEELSKAVPFFFFFWESSKAVLETSQMSIQSI